MKKLAMISALITTTVVILISCSSKRDPGKIYMPDMAYSRTYETYAEMDTTTFTTNPSQVGHKIYFNGMPVNGTMKRGELAPYTVANDSAGLLTASSLVKNPLPALNTTDSLEASRLYNINCGVCHGAKGENNGPVAEKIGGVKSIIASSPTYSDGRIFHVLTYGQNNMGSYASQLSREQRWMIVHYIRSLEPKKAVVATTAAAAAKADSATAKN